MKGNDGKGRRNALMRKLACIVLGFGGLLTVLSVLGIGNHSNRLLMHHDDQLPKTNMRRQQGGDGGGGDSSSSVMSTLSRLVAGVGAISARAGRGGGRRRPIGYRKSVDLEQNVPERVLLLSGSLNLIEIHSDIASLAEAPANTYSGVKGTFCHLNFSLQKKDPSAVPMFRYLVDGSTACSKQLYTANLKELAALARAHDAQQQQAGGSAPKALAIGGVVFHESRCGSTLVANSLVAMNPEKHRVYSESAPPIAALKSVCGETYQYCSIDQAASLLRDVMYLMSRTDNSQEERVFFKIQSIGTRQLQVFQRAFPTVPWIFVYREPVQVLMSQLEQGTKAANCVRPRSKPPTVVSDLLLRTNHNAHDVTDEEYCAAHLATLTESALAAMERAPNMGTVVNYEDLPQVLYEHVLPERWNIPVSDEEMQRIQKVSGLYSKGTMGRHGMFHSDSKRKEQAASYKVRDAAETFLRESYSRLERYRKDGYKKD